MMQFGAHVADLDLCDLRLSYDEDHGEYKTSTPDTSKRICLGDNLDCWDNDLNSTMISITESSSPPAHDSPDTDESYGGNWNKVLTDSLMLGEKRMTSINFEKMANANLNPQDMMSSEDDGVANSSQDTDHSYGGQWAKNPSDSVRSEEEAQIKAIKDADEDPAEEKDLAEDETPRNLAHIDSLNLGRGAPSNPFRAHLNRNDQVHHSSLTKLSTNAPLYHPDPSDCSEQESILDRAFCHAKDKAKPPSNDQTNNLNTFRNEDLRILVSNVRGWFGKRESLNNIVNSENIDIISLCETFTSGKRHPTVPGYTTYYRNRPQRAMGGIALIIKDEKAKYAVKVEEGAGDNEFIGVKFTNCEPHIVIFVYYGAISNTFGVDAKKLHISQLLDAAKKHLTKGCSVLILGDHNLQIGNEIIAKNHPDSNPTGRLYCDMIENLGLKIMNGLSDNPITYIDRSGANHRQSVLDLVVTNEPQNIHDFKTDDLRYQFTPYSVKMRKGKAERTHADHMSILFTFRARWCDRVKFKSEPRWDYRKPLGDIKYDLFTSNSVRYLLNKVIHEPDINKTHAAFINIIKKAKFQSFNKRTLTANKIKRLEDKMIWRERINDIAKLEKRLENEKESNKVFKMRKNILTGPSDRQNIKTVNQDTGQVLEDLDDVMNHILDFNVRNMEKVPPDQEVQEILRKKAEVMDELLSDHNVSKFPDSIPWEIFLKVLEKVTRQRKSCFRDIIKAGRGYKYALFHLLNRMYCGEEFPEASAITFLTRIWKGKGTREDLANSRFIHNREPVTKLFEKCVVMIVEAEINKATPQSQAGSRKGRSTRDQMLKLVILQKFYESQSRPLPILLVDVKACFDKIRLEDVVFDTLQAGADPKATRILSKLSDNTEIRLTGDKREEGRKVTGTLGQGTNYAPPGIGLTSSKSVDHKFPEETKNKLLARIGTARSDNQSYVDDISTFPQNEPCLRKVSVLMGQALRSISLLSHPQKTEVIISGRSARAEKMRERLTLKPAMMQDHPVKVAAQGMYLGMKVSQLGYRSTLDLTARHRVSKAWGRVADLKATINDARMSRIGWMRAGIVLIKSVIIPSITYSADIWLAANKNTEKFVTDEYKAIIYALMDIPTHTKFTSVLADLGLPNIVAVIDKLRVNFVNHTLWENGDVKLREMMLEERRLLPKNNLIQFTDQVCEKYNIPAVSENHLVKKMVKQKIRLCDEIDIWISNAMSPATMNVGAERLRPSTNFFILTKRKSQSLIAFNAGALKLRTSWGDFHQDQRCPAPLCGGSDSLEHIKTCSFYRTKWKDDYNKDCKQLAKYFVAIDRERRHAWRGECLF